MNETYIMQKILGTLIILLLAGCAGDSLIDRQLALAESLMDEKPDSVLAMLEAMDINDLETDRQRALYALHLYTAKYKLHIFESDDSLISIATDYFDKEDEPLNYVRSNLKRGQAHYWGKRYSNSITSALDALDVAKSIDDNLYIAKCYDLIADVYYVEINMNASIIFRKKALEYYRKTDREMNVLYAIVETAISCGNFEKYEESLSLLDSVSTLYNGNDSTFLAFYHKSYVRPLLKLKRYDQALVHFYKGMEFRGPNQIRDLGYLDICQAYIEKGNLDSADYYMRVYVNSHPDHQSNIDYHWVKGIMHKHKGEYQLALEEAKRGTELSDSMFFALLNNDIAYVDRDYQYRKSEAEKIKTEKQKVALAFLTVLMFILIFAFVSYYIYAKRRKLHQLESRMFELQELQVKLIESQSKIDNLSGALKQRETSIQKQQSLVNRLFSEHFAVLDNLSCEYFSKRDSDSAQVRQTIIKDFEREIAKIKHPDQIRKIEAIVNDCRDNIITRLRAQFPKFKEADITYLTLVLANFSPKAVCLLCDITIGNYYNKWTRLRARIADSAAPDREFFINTIDPNKSI